MKTCSKCHVEKPATSLFFSKDVSRKDGLHLHCKQCLGAYRAAHKDRINAKVRELTQINKDRYAVKQSAWRESRRVELAERTRKWNAENGQSETHKAKKSAYSAQWRKENRHKNVAKAVKYRSSKLQRTPAWFDADHAWVLQEAAELAIMREKMVGGKWAIDHVYPLAGKLVSGLHTMDNIQVVPTSFNIWKHNCFNPKIGPVRFFG